jgi:Synergist-CTERM protein sorting domain-containing protein
LSKKFLKLAALVAVLALASVAWAAGPTLREWQKTNDTYWWTKGNWSGAGDKAPGANNSDYDWARFINDATVTVSADADDYYIAIASLDVLEGKTVTLLISSDEAVVVGQTRSPKFQVSGDIIVGTGATLNFNAFNDKVTPFVLLSRDVSAEETDGYKLLIDVGESGFVNFNVSVDFGNHEAEEKQQVVVKKGAGTLYFDSTHNNIPATAALSIDAGTLITKGGTDNATSESKTALDRLLGITLSADAKDKSVTWQITEALSKDLNVYVGANTTIFTDNALNFGTGKVQTAGASGALLPSVTKKGAGTLTLADDETWDGVALNIEEGKVTATANAFKSAVSVDIAESASAILDLGADVTLGALTGKGKVTLARNAKLTISGKGKFEGDISGERAQLEIKTKADPAIIVELAGANTYEDSTTVESGILKLTGSVAGDVSVKGGASLDLGVNLANDLELADTATINVSADTELISELSGKLTFAGAWNKAGNGKLILNNSSVRASTDPAVYVAEGTLYAKKADVFDTAEVTVKSKAILEVGNGFDFGDVAVTFSGKDSGFKSVLSAVNVETPVATFEKITAESGLTLWLTLDAVEKDGVYKILTAVDEDSNLSAQNIVVKNADNPDEDIDDKIELSVSYPGNKPLITLTSLIGADPVELSPLDTTEATPESHYTGKITVESESDVDVDLFTQPDFGDYDWEATLSSDKTITISGDVPADFEEITFTVSVTTKGNAGFFAATKEETYTVTAVGGPVNTEDPEDVLEPIGDEEELFTQSELGVPGEPVTVQFKLLPTNSGSAVTLATPNSIELLFDPEVTPVPEVSGPDDDGLYSFTVNYVSGLKWGFIKYGANGQEEYKVEPTMLIQAAPEPEIEADIIAADTKATSFVVAVSYKNRAGDYEAHDVKVEVLKGQPGTTVLGTLTVKTGATGDVEVSTTSFTPALELTAATAYTVRVSDPEGLADSVTRPVTTAKADESGGSSGGCDAGFAGLALLLAAPLFLRKKSK